MEFEEISRNIHKRNDTYENHKLESQKYLENLESILFNEGLNKKTVLTDTEFAGPNNVYEKTMIYSNNQESQSIVLHIHSFMGKRIRRWDYNFYIICNEELKEKIKKSLSSNLNKED